MTSPFSDRYTKSSAKFSSQVLFLAFLGGGVGVGEGGAAAAAAASSMIYRTVLLISEQSKELKSDDPTRKSDDLSLRAAFGLLSGGQQNGLWFTTGS